MRTPSHVFERVCWKDATRGKGRTVLFSPRLRGRRSVPGMILQQRRHEPELADSVLGRRDRRAARRLSAENALPLLGPLSEQSVDVSLHFDRIANRGACTSHPRSMDVEADTYL